MKDAWNERIRCPTCDKIGVARLSQDNGDDTSTIESVPDGFKAVNTPHGPDFLCATCGVAVKQ